MNTTPDIDKTTGDYKRCPICGSELYWTIDFKKCTCKDRDCKFQNMDYENYSNKLLLELRINQNIKERKINE